MAYTHATSINKFGVTPLVVATSAANGSHTTLAGAMADAVSGQTIFLRDSVTENVTLTAGVNIAAWTGGTLNTPTITGTLTMTTAGTCNISGIRLQTNSAALLAVTGSAASIVNLDNCYLNCTNNTGITFSSSDAGAKISISDSEGNIGTTGITLIANSSAGVFNLNNTFITNSGGSSTASTSSAGTFNISFSSCFIPFSFSSASVGTFTSTFVSTTATNTSCITTSNTSQFSLLNCHFTSGSASSLSIGAGTTLNVADISVNSSNTNAVTGLGTLVNAGVALFGTSQVINTTTQTAKNFDVGGISFNGGTDNLQTYHHAAWTPNLQINGSSTGITYTTQLGGYTQIGNIVTVYAYILLSNKGASVGNVTISNLPVTSGANGGAQILSCSQFNGVTAVGYTTIGLQLGATSTVGTFVLSGSAVATIALADTHIVNTSILTISGMYIVD